MPDYHVGPAQPYATITAAFNATPNNYTTANPGQQQRIILHAAAYTEELNFAARPGGIPVMSSVERLVITVNGSDVVTWANGAGNRCIDCNNGNTVYATIEGGSGTLTIDGCAAGSESVYFEWPRNLTVQDCTVNGPNTAGSGAFYMNAFAEAYNADIQFDNVTMAAPQGSPMYSRHDDANYGWTGTVQNCLFQNHQTAGWYLRGGAKGLIIESNTFTSPMSAWEDCVQHYNTQNCGTQTITLRYNTITGVSVSSGSFYSVGSGGNVEQRNVSIYANLWYNSPGAGSGFSFVARSAKTGDNRMEIYNNTLDGENTSDRFIMIGGSVGTSHWNIRDNIFYDCGSTAVDQDGAYAGTETINYNCWNSNAADVGAGLAKGANAVNAYPQFTNEAADDYTLQATSPCINAGIDLGEGDDIGRYQYVVPGVGTLLTMNRGWW